MSRIQLYPIILFMLLSAHVSSQILEGVYDGWKRSSEVPFEIQNDTNSFVIILNETDEFKSLSQSENAVRILIECNGQSFKNSNLNYEIPITYWNIMDSNYNPIFKATYASNLTIGYIKVLKKKRKPQIEIVLYENQGNTTKPFYSITRKLKIN